MAAVTPTVVSNSTFEAGSFRILYLTGTLTTASDTITLTSATHGIKALVACIPVITSGYATTFAHVEASVDDLVATVTSESNTGGAASSFGDVGLLCIGTV